MHTLLSSPSALLSAELAPFTGATLIPSSTLAPFTARSQHNIRLSWLLHTVIVVDPVSSCCRLMRNVTCVRPVEHVPMLCHAALLVLAAVGVLKVHASQLTLLMCMDSL